MYLKRLSLINYKNFFSELFDFESKINCLVGDNGLGKTNVLDAIYYLSYTKSYFNILEVQNIKNEEDFFFIEGDYHRDERSEIISCSFKKGGKKVIKSNGKKYDKFLDHIGKIALVIVSPTDRDLIIEGSEIRRKFIDTVISQQDKAYLQNLINYNKVLAQRNALLKFFASNNTFDALNVSVYDRQLSDLANGIYEKRLLFIEQFKSLFEDCYRAISNSKERVNISYRTQLKDTAMSKLLESNLERDRWLQYTSVGIHRDDLQFEFDDHSIKKRGSQGQQKSYLIALKLAQFKFMKQLTGESPILLLDDIFDKLDENRVFHLVKMVSEDDFGQIFITDTHKDRIEKIIKQIKHPYKIFLLS